MKRKERNHTADKFSTRKAREGALISFSVMESFLGLFSTALTFCFVLYQDKMKGKEDETTHIFPKKLKHRAHK